MSDDLRVLLHVGYPKAASSFLQDWFARHPQIAWTHQRVGGVASTVDLHDLVESRQYADLRWLVTSDEDLAFWKGPIAPVGAQVQGYDVTAHQERLCRVLHALHPDATVLVVTRGFRSIMASSYSQYLRIGGTLDEAGWWSTYGGLMSDFWDYDHLLGLLRERFGVESVVTVPWELLRDDADRFLRVISDVMGVDPQTGTDERLKAGIVPEDRRGYRRLSEAVSLVARRLPDELGGRLYGSYTRQLQGDGLQRARRLAAALPGQPDHHVSDAEIRSRFSGKAELLRTSTAHGPYLREYLIGSGLAAG